MVATSVSATLVISISGVPGVMMIGSLYTDVVAVPVLLAGFESLDVLIDAVLMIISPDERLSVSTFTSNDHDIRAANSPIV